MRWSGIRFPETMMICLVLAGLVPEMIEAGCFCGGCWNMVCLSKVVWIEIFDMAIVGFAKSYEEIGHVLDVLVDALRQVGLVLNAGKTKKI